MSNIVIPYLLALHARCRDLDSITGLNTGKGRFINPTSYVPIAEPN